MPQTPHTFASNSIIEKIAHTVVHTKTVIATAVCLLYLGSPSMAIAQGVNAGTEIQNIATVTYEIAGEDQSPIESTPVGNSNPGVGNGSPTMFRVDRKIDLTVTGNNDANVVPGETQSEVTFTLTNEGNDTQEFTLTPEAAVVSDDFDPANCSYEVTAISGTPLPGVVIPTTGNILLGPDQQASIAVTCDIPVVSGGSLLSSGDTSLISLTAQAVKNSDDSMTTETSGVDTAENIETVFADDQGTDDANRDASHSARRTYLVSVSATPPTLSIEKSIVSFLDTNGGTTKTSGTEVTYKILVTSSGTGSINNVEITDPTPANMTYKPSSIILNSTNQSDANDVADNTDFGISIANTATIKLGNITAGSTQEIQLTYTIN
ncbi:hypothetical protein GCM10009133_15230 [Cocleimonas flava]|uniref:Putative repeat protein (TIGR01451 family) n=1 Tax=Cocleimonas flava TaxID=634765 RepID=A0A4R1F290_9GAMM|nr:hypothetical protein [Cocleimonas flava]TCJ84451.1 putative repeat protein (TIGR01451 family) [Cocleimonas flava]